MGDPLVMEILSQAFQRVYRSFGQYLRHEAWPEFDVGEDIFHEITEQEAADAQRLGEYIVQTNGSVYPGNYPISYGDVHFLNFSNLLSDWIPAQEALVKELEADLRLLQSKADPGVDILRDIVGHEHAALQKLLHLRSSLAAR